MTTPRKLYLTWEQFDAAVAALAAQIPEGTTCLYGLPRGGLPLAVALSHRTGLPLVHAGFAPGTLLIDDIADTGRALRDLRKHFRRDLAALVWVRRHSADTDAGCALLLEGDEWVVFPWESPDHADKDQTAYAARQ